MGRSKFPGKPSKLVTKKRVSVLNGNNINGSNNSISSGSSQNVAIVSFGAVSCAINDASNDIDADAETQNIAVEQQSNNNIEPDSDIALRSTAAKCDVVQANKSKESQLNNANENGVSEDGSSKKPTKKKKVSFKFGFETGDDAHIVKKEPTRTFDPPVSIIKKECLPPAIRIARGEPFLMPSRLTGLTKNQDLNKLDNVNSLTFKSHFAKCKQTRDENVTSNDEDQIDVGSKSSESSHSENSDEETSHSKKEEAITHNEEKSKAVAFQLPKRSAHSSRVIKPNKRFTDDSKTTNNKNGFGKKKGSNFETETDTVEANKKEDDDNVLKISDHIKNNPFAKINDDSPFGCSSMSILRQSRLQFASVLKPTSTITNTSIVSATNKESLFSSSLSGNSLNCNSIPLSNAVCGVCATPAAITHQTRKYGISSCESCRKFISKTVKRLTPSDEKSPAEVFQCKKGDGNCVISVRSFKASKKRCQACLLKKCLQTYKLPSEIRSRIQGLLPPSMRNGEIKSFSTTFQLKTESNNTDPLSPKSSGLNNLFGSSLSSCRRLVPTWPSMKDSTENTEFRSFNSLSNPLAENNSKFGSSPQIVPNILEKPTIMAGSLNSAISPNGALNKKTPELKESSKSPPSTQAEPISTSKSKSTPISNGTTTEQEETSRLRLRKKDRVEPSTTTLTITTTSTSTITSTLAQAVTVTTAGSELATRQRIDLKGPRVKRVCRSASIVLGQPIATFGDENQILDTLDTPPRPESPNGIVDFHDPATSICGTQTDKHNDQNECADSTRLSPPATPIINDYDSESTSTKEQLGEKSPGENSKSDDVSVTSVESLKRNEESKPVVTRKLSRPNNLASNSITAVNSKKLNSFIRKPIQKPAPKNSPPMISIDFWENYDPAEVSQNGFGLIFSEDIQISAACFLCGSQGQEPLIFCSSCCEPYHLYCVEDEYNLKQHVSLDDTNVSLLDASMISGIGSDALNSPASRLNWSCPRCTICHSCRVQYGSKVKCQKCHKNYHSTCLGTSKRLLGADRPLICASCLKCKSCGTTTVSKFVGNLPMCSQCFKLRQKGSFCPLCQRCYEDNDFNIKMMECGDCHRWVHSKCEGLTDEQYNLLSVLPENIEFICRKCAKTNPTASTWRDAVLAELKTGLLSVVKQLSKSRQACALLKLSPRKKPSMCRFCVQKAQQSENHEYELDDKLDDPFDFAASQIRDEMNCLPAAKCYCSTSLTQKPNTSQSLIDIKQKILTKKYYSLADFNYDMNVVINAAACDDLMTAYKEILSEAFPWFQNETKACTDALVEDMYDSCNFDHSTIENDEIDQQVPMIDVPGDIDEYFYQPVPSNDTRSCMFCKGCGDGASINESRLLYCGQNTWVHANCAMWSAEVFEEIDGSLQNVHGAISRGRMIKCSECGNKGATVGCNVRNCGEHYHFPCARKADCAFMTDKTVFCPQHSKNVTTDGKVSIETNFEVSRPVYVELDRKRRRPVCPKKVQFLIGSLHVKQLGRFVNVLSDFDDFIVPADFLCSRWYWSTKEPWKIVEYTIRTSVQSNLNIATDAGRNFTVDHSNSLSKVQIGLAKIAKWHSSLLNGDENDGCQRPERSLKLVNGHSEETNEDEPQTNVLPPEIQDAILEDIPLDILNVFSMLDIFPEDMAATADTKNEAIINSDLLRDNTTDDDFSQGSQKGFDIDSWTSVNLHAEDAMLSARSAAGQVHLKRNKSDLFTQNALGNRGQRTWENALDSTICAKRRKIFLTLGRRKEEISNNYNEIKRLQSEEIKNKFTWEAAKKICQLNNDTQQQQQQQQQHQKNNTALKNSFKIPQSDGMDDEVCDRCHCTYRSRDAYQRHLPTCETFLSTNESDSDATSKSPEIQQAIQSNMILTSMNGQDYCNIPILQQNNQSQQIFGISGANINQLAMQNSVQIHNGQSLPIASIQNGSLPVQMQGMFINPNTTTIQPQQSQIFGQQLTLGALQQPVFSPIQNIAQNVTSQNIQYQPHIITCSAANTSQVLTVTPSQQQNITTSNYASIKTIQTQPQVNRNAIILPQADKNSPTKKQAIAKLQMSPTRAKGRIATTAAQKTIQIKKSNMIKTENNKTVAQITNTSVTNIRPTSTTQMDNNNIMIQSTNPTQSQPIIMQQVAQANQGNLLQYVATSDSNNGLQYFTMPTNDVKPMQTTQYLTPNPLIPGTFQLQSDNSNLLLANTASGLQVLPNGTLQLAQSQQPQVIGTLIQPQATTIQCGMMSSEQMVLGATPSFEMVTNPLQAGCMLLNSQPVYYGLETIVQNTVMQSQQFVSTAMQGVLSQNSSFSATTTQVFQASKIEPIMDMQQSYVVLNNDGTIMTPQSQQPILTTANLLQQAIPQMSNQTSQIQPAANTGGWRIIDANDKATVFSTNQNATILQPQSQANVQPLQTNTTTTVNIQHPMTAQQQPQQQQQQQQQQQVSTVTPQPVVQLQKVQPQKQVTKQRQPKQTYSAKTMNKPTLKSSPIIVNEIQTMSQNDVKPVININSKPIETKIEIGSPKTPMITTSSGNDVKMSSKVVPPIVTQRKLNTTKSIASGVKVSAATVKPKIVGKTLKQSNAQNIQKPLISVSTSNAPLSTTTLPLQTFTITTAKPTLQNINTELDLQLKPIVIPKSPLPILSNEPLSNENNMIIDGKMSITNTIPKINTSIASPMQQSPTISSTGNQFGEQSPNNLQSSQLSSTLSPTNDAPKLTAAQFTSNSSNQTHITLPLSHCIQLPTAPYANGIPTNVNVVNPIQQYTHTNTRPTNRVLPMQTILPKCSPTESIETKPNDIKLNLLKLDSNDRQKKTPKNTDFMPTSSGNTTPEIKLKDDSSRMDDDMEVDSTGTGALEIDEDQISDFKIEKMDEDDSDNSSDMDAFKDSFPTGSSAEEVFDKLKKEEQEKQTENMVKENISKIIEKFECDEKSSIEEEDDLFTLAEVDVPSDDITAVVSDNTNETETGMPTCDEIVQDQKENVNPISMPLTQSFPTIKMQKPPKELNVSKITGPRLLYEIQSQDGFTYKSTSITEIWEKLFEAVQIARKAHGLSPLPVGPLADMCGHQMMGLKTNALKYLLEQLPGVERCSKYTPIYHKRAESTVSQTSSSGYWSDCEEIKENASGTARCEKYKGRSEYDMFSWLASRHRKQPIQICVPQSGVETETIVRRGSGSSLPKAMRYRTLKDTYKDSVGVYRSQIHGRGLFCNRDIEAGEMVIEYAGELIRSSLTDKRERYYDSRGIGCYMFKIDDKSVVDATMRGNAARFINHSCEPNCYSKVVDILGHKHIIIFALRRIVQGEELTYDYKFPFEETKIPCSCGSRKCRKYLN
ncbi:histone-lysine N-methyltransferase trithorax [Contarinia nasturtii]|uniref:histone-lysine N-methyltransferase trithorax n=1 Tax=Contarinia nasturtii TaxID=265458 RepID=UPI0012D42C67|nr:histone-lysine N-methyltransferase trithorax [Contarinia nasturtii]